MSADARVARAIKDVRQKLDSRQPPRDLRIAVETLIDEAKDALDLTDEDIDNY